MQLIERFLLIAAASLGVSLPQAHALTREEFYEESQMLDPAAAFVPDPAAPDPYQKLYDQMSRWNDCGNRLVHSACVKRAREDDGSWKKPDPENTETLKRHQRDLIQIANEYGIDARTLVGVILADHTMNQGVQDKLEDKISAVLGADRANRITGRIFHSTFSTGLAQIKPIVACSEERRRAAIEKRVARDCHAAENDVNDPIASLRIAASFIRHCQDVYTLAGFDIHDRIGVLATLFNLGGPEARSHALAERRKKEKEKGASGKPVEPGWNYMGLWVEVSMPAIQEILGPDYHAVPAPKPLVVGHPISVSLDGADPDLQTARGLKPEMPAEGSSGLLPGHGAPASVNGL